jgi:HAD superfamily hydrolase (TIGR01509 family)
MMEFRGPETVMIDLVIFDFDGVIADSELLANAVLAEAVSELGLPTSLDDSLAVFAGKRAQDIAAIVEARTGRPVPPDFRSLYEGRTLERFRTELKAIDGVRGFISSLAPLPICIASSSTPARLALSLEVLGLSETFGANVFSAAGLARGKPAPDIFLLAAERMAVAPERALVIEDSVSGVSAGVAAGATVVGLLAGSHIRPHHRRALIDAGAHYLADSFSDVADILERLIER